MNSRTYFGLWSTRAFREPQTRIVTVHTVKLATACASSYITSGNVTPACRLFKSEAPLPTLCYTGLRELHKMSFHSFLATTAEAAGAATHAKLLEPVLMKLRFYQRSLRQWPELISVKKLPSRTTAPKLRLEFKQKTQKHVQESLTQWWSPSCQTRRNRRLLPLLLLLLPQQKWPRQRSPGNIVGAQIMGR